MFATGELSEVGISSDARFWSRFLKLADCADLEKLSDFTLIDVFAFPPKAKRGTRICIEQWKPFVKRETACRATEGFVRNVASRSDFEQLVSHLSRCTPIDYQNGIEQCATIAPLMKDASPPTLEVLRLRHGQRSEILTKAAIPIAAGGGNHPSRLC